MGGRERHPQPFLTGAQLLLMTLAVGNVGGDAAGGVDTPKMVEQRDLDGDIGMQSVPMGCELLRFEYSSRRLHQHIVRPKGIGELFRKDLVIRLSPDLLEGD